MSLPTIAPAAAGQNQQQDQDSFTRRLLQIEQAAVRAIVTMYLMQLAQLSRQARAMVLMRGAEAAAQALASQLVGVGEKGIDRRQLLAAADRYAQQAVDLGTTWAQGTTVLEVPTVAQDAMQAAIATAEQKIAAAVKLMRQADTMLAVQSALTVAKSASVNLATGAEYAVNASSNDAIRRTAALAGAELLWIAERDACVICLALSGQTVNPSEGEAFDEFATFDPTHPAPEVWPKGMPLIAPPRHPHCRCTLKVWYGTAVAGFDLPDILRREALRSVARGWSLPSESGAARRRAAEYILRSGLAARLPKSVQAEAERGAAGNFRDRNFPHHGHRTNVR